MGGGGPSLSQAILDTIKTHPGLKGPMGPAGSQGDVGPRGVQGEQGIQGGQGVQGIQGVQGVQGEVGPSGTTVHSVLTGLTTSDDHTQYVHKNGRTGGQTIAGLLTFSDTTNATSSTSGGLTVLGGLAVAKTVVIGNSAVVPNVITSSITAPESLGIYSTGTYSSVNIWTDGIPVASFGNVGLSMGLDKTITTGKLYVDADTVATTSDAALDVNSGGAHIKKNLIVEQKIEATGDISTTGNITCTNLEASGTITKVYCTDLSEKTSNVTWLAGTNPYLLLDMNIPVAGTYYINYMARLTVNSGKVISMCVTQNGTNLALHQIRGMNSIGDQPGCFTFSAQKIVTIAANDILRFYVVPSATMSAGDILVRIDYLTSVPNPDGGCSLIAIRL